MPLYKNGTLIGVSTADFTLEALNTFMQSLTISERGKAFIVDKSGYLIAGDITSEEVRTLAIDSTEETIKSCAQFMISEYGSIGNINSAQSTYYNDGKETQFWPCIGG